jgi:hypothetical protein
MRGTTAVACCALHAACCMLRVAGGVERLAPLLGSPHPTVVEQVAVPKCMRACALLFACACVSINLQIRSLSARCALLRSKALPVGCEPYPPVQRRNSRVLRRVALRPYSLPTLARTALREEAVLRVYRLKEYRVTKCTLSNLSDLDAMWRILSPGCGCALQPLREQRVRAAHRSERRQDGRTAAGTVRVRHGGALIRSTRTTY